jgi:SAM-dependent methyltransferase
MSADLLVPDAAIPYILFQRTAYLRFPIAPLYRLFNRILPFDTPLYNSVIAIESRLRRRQIKALYAEDMQREYQTIRDYLPQRCAAVLDIGCGVAGIDVLLQRHYACPNLRFYLLDRSELARRVFYLFNERAAFYNSLDVARALLVGNGIAAECVELVEANERNEIRIDAQIDLALSLLSWGFHYPLATYLDRVRELLRDDGVVILDLRRGTDGLATLRRSFRKLEVVQATEKFDRVAAWK